MGATCSRCSLREDELAEMDISALKDGKGTNYPNSASRPRAEDGAKPGDSEIEAAAAEDDEGGMDAALPHAGSYATQRPSLDSLQSPTSPGSPCLLTPSDELQTDQQDAPAPEVTADIGESPRSQLAATPFQFKPSVATWFVYSATPLKEIDSTDAVALQTDSCRSTVEAETSGNADVMVDGACAKQILTLLYLRIAFAEKVSPNSNNDPMGQKVCDEIADVHEDCKKQSEALFQETECFELPATKFALGRYEDHLADAMENHHNEFPNKAEF